MKKGNSLNQATKFYFKILRIISLRIIFYNFILFYSNSLGACSKLVIDDSNDSISYDKLCGKELKNFAACDLRQKEIQDSLNSSFDACDFTEIKRIRLDSAETVINYHM